MTTDFDTLTEIDSVKIKKALEFQVPIEVATYTLPKSMELYIRKVLMDFLTLSHQNHMIEYLNFCLGELLTNAKKANTKRVYFEEKGLDINDEEQYEIGMKNFKEDTLSNINHYLELQKKAGLYVKMLLQVRSDSSVRIEIQNNSRLTVFEKKRIQDKLNSVRQYTSINEVMSSVMDQSEGAGLGIIIMILMLQKIGLSKDNYQIFDEDGITVTRIILPCNCAIQNGVNSIFQKNIANIKQYPVLERNYNQLQSIIASGCDRSQIVDLLNKDSVLSFLLLSNTIKNNPQITVASVVNSLSDEEIKNIFAENNPDIIFVSDADYERYTKIAYKTALCAYNLGKNTSCKKFTCEELYVMGLMSGLGRLVYSGLPVTMKTDLVTDFCSLENSLKVSGVYNTETNYCCLGAGILSSKGFPEKYLDVLKLCCEWNFDKDIDTSDPVAILVMSQMISYYDEDELEFYQLNPHLLKAYNITNEEQLRDLLSKVHNIM